MLFALKKVRLYICLGLKFVGYLYSQLLKYIVVMSLARW